MRVFNAFVFTGAAFVPGGVEFDTRFRAVGGSIRAGELDAGGAYLIPGLVDVHTHGAVGCPAFGTDAEGLERLAEYYARGGVTSFCPTAESLPEEALTSALGILRSCRRQNGARIAGVHLEGPFLSREKRGAQNPAYLHAPDTALFHRLQEAAGGLVRLVTVAPEEEGGLSFVREISRECTVSLGHSIADYDTAMAAFYAGATHVSHIYNGMSPMHHRAPGLIAAAADACRTAELICDGEHVHPSMIRLTHRVFGERLVLVSDSLECAGMPDGEYSLGGLGVTLQNGRAVLTKGGALAGGAIHLMQALRRAVSFGVPLIDAVRAATMTPARVIGLEHEIGSVSVGKRADFVLLDEKLRVKAVFIDGKQISP